MINHKNKFLLLIWLIVEMCKINMSIDFGAFVGVTPIRNSSCAGKYPHLKYQGLKPLAIDFKTLRG